jgi:excisionase family DNA binding protein
LRICEGRCAVSRSSVLSAATRVDPGPEDRESVQHVRQVAEQAVSLVLRLSDGRELALPATLMRLLLVSAGELSQGRAVTVLASEVTLTPAEAGELLGLSRPFIVRLIDAGDLPAEHLPNSTHRVVRLSDVLAFQERRDRRREGRRRLAEAVESENLPY